MALRRRLHRVVPFSWSSPVPKIVVHVAALGSSFVTVSNGGITNIIQVIVENPIATSLYIDAAHAIALPKFFP